MANPEHLPAVSDSYILQRLAQEADLDDLLLEICQKNGLDWNQAEAYVSALERRSAARIVRRQSPILILLSLGAFIAGAALGLAYYLDVSQVFLIAAGRRASGLPELFSFAFMSTYELPLLIMGTTLAAGGALGLARSLLNVFKT